MKKLVSLLVIAAFAASPAAAATKRKMSKEAAEIAKQNDNTRRALRDAVPLVLPVWALPFYFNWQQQQIQNEKKKK
jgi:hypothetical protein